MRRRQRKPVVNNTYAEVKPRTPRAVKLTEEKVGMSPTHNQLHFVKNACVEAEPYI